MKHIFQLKYQFSSIEYIHIVMQSFLPSISITLHPQNWGSSYETIIPHSSVPLALAPTILLSIFMHLTTLGPHLSRISLCPFASGLFHLA
jgi:hypothetical protein